MEEPNGWNDGPGMSRLVDELAGVLPPGFAIPDPIRGVYEWVENSVLYEDALGWRYGFLYPHSEFKTSETAVPRGTDVQFTASGNANVHHWLHTKDPEPISRLCVFAQTGAEGTESAFWLDDDGRQRIVQMGSGSGSMSCCVLADDAVDFLRLLAIGYEEIAWNEDFRSSPTIDPCPGFIAFREWVCDTFQVTIPATAAEIVRYPDAEIGDANSDDPFCRWITRHHDAEEGGGG